MKFKFLVLSVVTGSVPAVTMTVVKAAASRNQSHAGERYYNENNWKMARRESAWQKPGGNDN